MIQRHGCLLDTNVLVYSADLGNVKKQDQAIAKMTNGKDVSTSILKCICEAMK